MLIQACLNGSRHPDEHSALPVTPEGLALDAELTVAAGARSLHLHPRNARGEQSLAAEDIAASLNAIRLACSAIPVGVSTGLWIERDVQRRLQCVQDWTVLPDFASVNFSEPGSVDLCHLLLERGIGIEAGLWSVEDAQLFLTSGLADRCLRVLIELQEPNFDDALVTAAAIIRCLNEGNVHLSRLLHGDNEAIVWPMLEVALQRGYDTRIGFEDTLTLPDGSKAKDNAELVAVAMDKARRMGVL